MTDQHCPKPEHAKYRDPSGSGTNFSEEKKPIKYSIIIDIPSPDIDPAGMEQVHATFALDDIEKMGSLESLLPEHVREFFLQSVNVYGAKRVEIIHSSASYKLYVKPDKVVEENRVPTIDTDTPEEDITARSMLANLFVKCNTSACPRDKDQTGYCTSCVHHPAMDTHTDNTIE